MPTCRRMLRIYISVEYVRLFHTLRDRNMCPTVLRLSMNMYVNQSFQVKWNTIVSSQSHIYIYIYLQWSETSNCLSPTLLSVYMNELYYLIVFNTVLSMYEINDIYKN